SLASCCGGEMGRTMAEKLNECIFVIGDGHLKDCARSTWDGQEQTRRARATSAGNEHQSVWPLVDRSHHSMDRGIQGGPLPWRWLKYCPAAVKGVYVRVTAMS